MPRWLFALITVLALCVRGVTGYAAAGWVGDTSCCCPSPEVCKCHDHDGKPHPDATMKRCGGDAQQVAPDLVTATAPASPPVTEHRVVARAPAWVPRTLVSRLPGPPVPPPI
ncbi:MAG: hypothetical protein JNL83_34690 [Myxococcales bacterium]|nr:hypothetical protein [Myxococcales bacterium]